MDYVRVARNTGNVANLSTPLGLLVAVAGGARLRSMDGLIVAENVSLPGISASAMTIGSVVLVPRRTLEEATARIPGLLLHEDQHAHQWAYCLGLPFIPLYLAAMGWSWLRSGDRWTANCFEVQAGLARGGYTTGDTRPVRDGLYALHHKVSAAAARRSVRPAAGNAADAGA